MSYITLFVSTNKPQGADMSTRLKLLRQQHGLSLEQLAQRSGLTKSYVSKVERGLSTPSIASASPAFSAWPLTVSRPRARCT